MSEWDHPLVTITQMIEPVARDNTKRRFVHLDQRRTSTNIEDRRSSRSSQDLRPVRTIYNCADYDERVRSDRDVRPIIGKRLFRVLTNRIEAATDKRSVEIAIALVGQVRGLMKWPAYYGAQDSSYGDAQGESNGSMNRRSSPRRDL